MELKEEKNSDVRKKTGRNERPIISIGKTSEQQIQYSFTNLAEIHFYQEKKVLEEILMMRNRKAKKKFFIF